MIQNDRYTSCDYSEFDENCVDDDLFCNNNDDQSIMFDNGEGYKSVKLDDNHYYISRSKSDSETLHYKPRL